MKIEKAKILDEEISLSEDLPADSWDLDSNDAKFTGDIHVDCKFQRAGKELLARGMVKLNRDITCSRCLGPASQEVIQDFCVSYSEDSVGDYLNIDNDIREQILLNFPMKVLCGPQCKGICPGCGSNLNTEQCQCKHTKVEEE